MLELRAESRQNLSHCEKFLLDLGNLVRGLCAQKGEAEFIAKAVDG
jgi:hypothetical protein